MVAAGKLRDPASVEALAALCESYWYPVYAHVRRKVYSTEDAEDLTQEFFTLVIEKNYLADVRRERGRFRSFLSSALQHFLANEGDRRRAAKRGGGKAPLSLDFDKAEELWAREPSPEATPEEAFERRWAVTLLERVLAALRKEYERSGKSELFTKVKVYLVAGHARPSYRLAATELAMTEGAFKVAVHRVRKRFGRLLRNEIADTVSSPEETEDELRYLLSTLSSRPGPR